MDGKIKIFIGYDRSEELAYHVLYHSILRRSSIPIEIHPLYRPHLEASGLYNRERAPTESTEFSLTRFLVPHLAGDDCDIAIFMDCDMLCLGDIADLVQSIKEGPLLPVSVVKHKHIPKTDVKFDGAVQTKYGMKNWSSLMVFRPWMAQHLPGGLITVEDVNTMHGLELHQFKWLQRYAGACEEKDFIPQHLLIGEIDPRWNYLVGYTEGPPTLIHFTDGGPWHKGYEYVEFSDKWHAELQHLLDGLQIS